MRRLGRHLRSHTLAYLALFLAATLGTAYALDRNSVSSRHVVDGQIKPRDLAEPEYVLVEANPKLPAEADPCDTDEVAVFCGIDKSFGRFDGWQDLGAGYGPAAFYRDGFGTVHLEGAVIRAGAPGDERAIFILPPRFRPAVNHSFPRTCMEEPPTAPTTPNDCGLVVRHDGRVVAIGTYDAGSSVGTSLSGIAFQAD